MKIITDKTEIKEIKWKTRNLNIDLKNATFELDVLQESLIRKYLSEDMNFRRAYYTDYTPLFFQFIKDKVQLNEPMTFSIMGQTRSGKSSCAICVAGLIMQARGKLMSIKKIMSSEYDYMQTLKENKDVEFGDAFVIDESKQAVFGLGSQAKKLKLQDVQNIIAVNNISTLWLRPDGWSFENSQYGLRAFGRGQFYKDGSKMPIRLNRFMLYNLQETSAGGSLPLGMVYIPHFADYLENGKQLWDEYSKKKQDWVDQEQKGVSDNIQESMFKLAERLNANVHFANLKKNKEKEAFISTALGSEATKGEIMQILTLSNLIKQGFTIQQIRDAIK